jgi:hypothetical protein
MYVRQLSIYWVRTTLVLSFRQHIQYASLDEAQEGWPQQGRSRRDLDVFIKRWNNYKEDYRRNENYK